MESRVKKSNTILVVEDHEDSRSMMRKLLELDGFRVITAATGARAIKLANETKPDIILMDLSLPDVDGIVVTKEIRRHSTTRQTPIIALTAYDMDDCRIDALAAGCNEFMLKPVDFERLEAALKRWLGPHERDTGRRNALAQNPGNSFKRSRPPVSKAH